MKPSTHRSALIRSFSISIALVLGTLLAAPCTRAADPPESRASEGAAGAPPSSGSEPAPAAKLKDEEASLGRRYRQFEKTLLQMAEYLRKAEPERADLLIRAIARSKEDRIAEQMEQISELLKSDQFGDAIGRQEHLSGNLRALLELLQSEDRRHQLEEEKKWYEMLQKEVARLSAREKDLRKATDGCKDCRSLADRQNQIGGETKSLVEKIAQKDAARNGEKKEKPSSDARKESPKDAKTPDQKGGKQPQDNNSKKPDGKQQNGKQNPSGKNSSGKPDSGKPQEGQPGGKESKKDEQKSEDSSPQDPKAEAQKTTPGREEIEAARKAMQQAEEELKKLEGSKAIEQQEQAIQKLAEAKERLEQILRQLRQEEQEIMLASLEARFAKMLLAQLQIHVDTVALSRTAKEAWTAKHFGRSRELSVLEDAVAAEAAKALVLLKEEGSSVAFPKGVEQIREDMLTIARRLDSNDVAELTQSIEKDVIESLEELVAALQSEIENRKKPEEQRSRQRAGQNQRENPLVEQLAELKMLRSLQLRVNRRTRQIGRLIKGEQSTKGDLTLQLRELARRQEEIQEATYILASGRNQ